MRGNAWKSEVIIERYRKLNYCKYTTVILTYEYTITKAETIISLEVT